MSSSRLLGIANGFVGSTEHRINTLRSYFQTFLHRTPTNTELLPVANTARTLLDFQGLVLSSPEFFANGLQVLVCRTICRKLYLHSFTRECTHEPISTPLSFKTVQIEHPSGPS
jgi:hypothetical protein